MTQIPGLYLGATLGGTVGVAIAFSMLMILYSIFNYLIQIRALLGPCLREYIGAMWPASWMTGVMMLAVLVISFLFQPPNQSLSLIVQILAGIVVYFGLLLYWQKPLFSAIRDMVIGKTTN